MKKKGTYSVIALIALVIICSIAACKKGGSTDDGGSLFGTYDQQTMLANIGNNVIVPAIKNFADASNALNTAISSFTSEPDATSLAAAQNAWAQLALKWAAIAPFDFGPVSDNLWYAQIDTWPANTTKIEAAIAYQADAGTQGSDAKGLKALEYLLFNSNGNSAVLAQYQGSNATATNRKNYLASAGKNLSSLATKLQDAWTGNYLNIFTNAKGNDVSSSASLLVNTLSLYLDEVKNMKIGNPIGMGVKMNDGQPHPDKIEYKLAEESIAVMIGNMQGMKAAFNGGSGQGLDDLLDFVKAKKDNQNLSAVVNSQFDDVINKLNAIATPYATAVGSQTQQLTSFFNTLKQLIAYFKVDVANNLGVTITFTDTDGD